MVLELTTCKFNERDGNRALSVIAPLNGYPLVCVGNYLFGHISDSFTACRPLIIYIGHESIPLGFAKCSLCTLIACYFVQPFPSAFALSVQA
jgi:hypothetical protein